MKFEVTGDEELARTFVDGLTEVFPRESTASSAKPLDNKVTLELVVSTDNVQVMTGALVEDAMLRAWIVLEEPFD